MVSPADVYNGDFVKGMKHGKGTYIHANGDTWVGDFVENRFEGEGIMWFANGDTFHGTMKGNKKHGEGRYLFHSSNDHYGGTEFTGQFEDDFMKKGIMKFSDGSTYMGEFAEGLRNGRGRMVHANGDVQDGKWVRGFYRGPLLPHERDAFRDEERAAALALAAEMAEHEAKRKTARAGTTSDTTCDTTDPSQGVAGKKWEEGGEGCCVICMTERATHAMVPCGHLCLCAADVALLFHKEQMVKCPVCRKTAHTGVHIFAV